VEPSELKKIVSKKMSPTLKIEDCKYVDLQQDYRDFFPFECDNSRKIRISHSQNRKKKREDM
jgi:hypothetical protein